MPYKGSIIGRESNSFEGFSTKLYTFRSYVDNVLGGNRIGCLGHSSRLLFKTLTKTKEGHEIMDEPYKFAIALAFGDKEENEVIEGIDIFAARFGHGESWKDVPMYDSWTFENGVFVPRNKGTTCGVGLRIFGMEEELRAETNGPEQFLRQWPPLGDLYDADFLKTKSED